MADIGGSAIEASEPSVGPDLAGLRGLRVLRLCSVFEPATLTRARRGTTSSAGCKTTRPS